MNINFDISPGHGVTKISDKVNAFRSDGSVQVIAYKKCSSGRFDSFGSVVLSDDEILQLAALVKVKEHCQVEIK